MACREGRDPSTVQAVHVSTTVQEDINDVKMTVYLYAHMVCVCVINGGEGQSHCSIINL